MTATKEKPLSQAQLLVDEPPELRYLGPIPIDRIQKGPWGPEPDPQFCRAIATNGVLQPIIVELAGDNYLIRDGRKRIQAAEKAGQETILAIELVPSGRPGLVENVVTLATNAVRGNPIIEFRAIEDVELAARGSGKTVDDVAIARATGMPLSIVKKRRRLANLLGDLREAWEEGKFGDKVGIAAAKLEQAKQSKLLKKLAAEGTLTLADVQEAAKTGVKAHQRRLPDDTWRDRVCASLKAALSELEEHDEDTESELRDTIQKALDLALQGDA